MTRLNTPSAKIIRRFTDIVGAAHAISDPADQAPYLKEWRDLYTGKTPLVLRPGTTDEVSRILALANENSIGIVPQAGNTGLVGGQIPHETGTEIVVSVDRMRRIRVHRSRRHEHGRRSRADACRSAGRRRHARSPVPA